MRARTASWLAGAILVLTLALHSGSYVLVFLGRNITTPGDQDTSFSSVGFLLAFIAFPLVGAMIVIRRPRNSVGWLFLLIGAGFALSDATATYADYAVYADPGSLPAGVWAGWITSWTDPLAFVSLMLLFLLFPDGALLSRSWRPALWLVLAFAASSLVWNALKPGIIFQDTLPFDNPAGVPWLQEHLGFIDTVIFFGFAAGSVLSVASVVLRFRRSQGIERDRMKWLVFAGLLLLGSFLLAIGLSATTVGGLGDLSIGLGFAAVPLAVGVGVLRYRLYDIDRVISRTLSFAVVTFALAAVYVGLVLVGQALFSSVAGGGGLVIAGSTLVVAALFLPARTRIQGMVDRRFNRHRYDAQLTLRRVRRTPPRRDRPRDARSRSPDRGRRDDATRPRLGLAARVGVSRRRSTPLAWALVLLTVAVNAGWIGLLVLNVRTGLTGSTFSYGRIFSDGAPALAYVVVGFLVASRKPENPIGWLLLLAGLVFGLPLLAQHYAAYDLLAHSASLPGARLVAISLNGMWIPGLFVLLLIAFLFPTGELPSPRWRPVIWVAATSLTLLMLLSHVSELDPPFSKIDNPFRMEFGLALSALALVSVLCGVVGSAIAACASVVIRFRHAAGDERAQLKWFVLAASLLPLGLCVHLLAETVAPGAVNSVEAAFSLAVAMLPIAIGVAILKYRLYEIDRIISRALVYGSVTVVLGAAYAGLVLAGQALFETLTGGSNLAIAVSTLAVAALFLPVRARVQAFVDRRFYRRRYDAQRTLEAFGSRLREQIELDALSENLLGAVGETMQPLSASLWLNGSPTDPKPVTIP